ncbi:Hypothetical predicted protein [Pelobates cultripes]|uniref:Uncharacterized protein n=1 Tax=Pelobates cultripes TaxID=61616 RepID=A0AAD1T6L8_PELCU|nr:Hypothetical predicted protein [Pelobates cultripes]
MDVIICFQSGQDRLTFMVATLNKSPYRFEDHDSTFYPDLSKSTLDWRRSMHPLNKELSAHNKSYMWGTPCCLIITCDTGTLKVTHASQITSTLQGHYTLHRQRYSRDPRIQIKFNCLFQPSRREILQQFYERPA